MTNEELATLINANGDPDGALRLRLLEMNRGYIYGTTYKRFSPFIEYEDVESIAFIAITQAVQTYSPERGSFLQSLSWALNSEFGKAVNDVLSIHAPDDRKRDLRRLQRAIRDYVEAHDKEPSENILERSTGFTDEYIRELRSLGQALYPESLDAEIVESDDGDTFTLGDAVPSDTDVAEDSVNHCYLDQLASFIEECIKALPKECRLILNLHFYDGQSLNSIAETQNMHVNEVRKLKDKAIKVLRRNDRLRQYFETENEYSRIGLTRFKNTYESSTEFHAIRLYDLKGHEHED